MFKNFLTKPDFILLLVVLVLLPIFSGCGDSNNSTLPETIINSEISAGSSYSATIKDGSLFLWGYNSFGQLGTGNSTNENIPKQLTSVPAYWKQISVGYTHTAAVATNGTLWTWGDNGFGQLGVGNRVGVKSPVKISSDNVTSWKFVSTGDEFTIAISDNDSLWSWGYNGSGQLGTGNTSRRTSPTNVAFPSGVSGWKTVVAGDRHAAAIANDGSLWTWGRNDVGQLGVGDTTNRTIPTKINSNVSGWKYVNVGSFHTVAIANDGSIWVWGNNYYGQLGLGDNTNRYSPTKLTSTITEWIKIDAGYEHTVALSADGSIWAWGSNYAGQLGLGNKTNENIPKMVNLPIGISGWKDLTVGSYHVIAVAEDSSIWVWGKNDVGQLGLNDNIQRESPTKFNIP